MSKEAMKLALEALEDLIPLCDPGFSVCYDVNKAITALREALAEPDFWEGYVPEPVKPAQQGCMRCNTPKKCALYGCSPLTWPSEQPAQQEPVACKTLCELCVERGYIFCTNAAQTTLIPSPPAQPDFWEGYVPEPVKPAQYSDIVSDGGVDPRNKFDKPSQDSGVVTAGGFDPRTQRTWVGLTAKDWNVIGFTAEFRAGAEWAHDKLKEKNNG